MNQPSEREKMTSQVAVTNFNGIAVASDTIVSISTSEGIKTMGNAEKVFDLGQDHKVLILHSGNADLNEVSNWLQLNEWINTLTNPLATLQDYVDSYLSWSNSSKNLHIQDSESRCMNYCLNDHYYYIKHRIQEKYDHLTSQLTDEESLFSESDYLLEVDEVITTVIGEAKEYLESLPNYDGFSDNDAAYALSKSEIDLKEKLDFIFEGLPLNDGNYVELSTQAAMILSRAQNMNSDSILAFAGFGLLEPFGGNIRVRLRGFYGGGLRAQVDEKFSVSPDGSKSTISHFAQGGAIFMFVRGLHSQIYDKIMETVEKLVNQRIENDPGKNVGAEIVAELSEELNDYSQTNFVTPLLATIEGMSTLSLADFAESLVGLQITSTLSENSTATVGGFIEVATIDRAHGVVWRKRLSK